MIQSSYTIIITLGGVSIMGEEGVIAGVALASCWEMRREPGNQSPWVLC